MESAVNRVITFGANTKTKEEVLNDYWTLVRPKLKIIEKLKN